MLQGSLKYRVADILDNILNLLDAGFAILDKELNIIWVNEIQLITERGERKYIQNISSPMKEDNGGINYLLKISLDITAKEEKIQQLSLLRKLAELMQGILQTDKLLHLILTCVTAGTAL